jgi:hypothetical protein
MELSVLKVFLKISYFYHCLFISGLAVLTAASPMNRCKRLSLHTAQVITKFNGAKVYKKHELGIKKYA